MLKMFEKSRVNSIQDINKAQAKLSPERESQTLSVKILNTVLGLGSSQHTSNGGG